MAITHKYTLLCDDIRQENNGKFIILGLYTPDIAVQQLPFALPSLSFFTVLDSDTAAANVDFNFRLNQGETLIAGGGGRLNAQRGWGVVPIRLGPLQLPAAGPYRFTLDIAGNPAITHEFAVSLQVANLGMPGPPLGGPVH